MSTQHRSSSVFLTCLFAILMSASAGASVTKLRVDDPKDAARLVAHGGRLLADYGSFQMIETDNSTVNALALPSVESAEESNVIELNAKHLDTRSAEVKALRKDVAGFSGKKLHLIQFVGPPKPEWVEALEGTGVKVVQYVPANSYLVQGSATALAKLQNWARTADFVQWEGPFADEYKVHPKARATDAKGNLIKSGVDTYTVQLFEDGEANPETRKLIDKVKQGAVEQEFQVLHYLNIVVKLPAEALAQVAARPDVVSIHLRPARRKLDERQDQIMAGNLTGSVPSGPGYLAWLASKGFTQAQFNASGFAVDVSDSGIDNGTTSPGHFELYRNGDPNLPSRVVYNRLEGTPNSGSTLAGCDGHGNLNAHIVGGYNNRTAVFPFADSGGYRYGLGVCPFVKLGSSVIFDTDNFTHPSYPDLASRAYRDSARISNNSWGSDSPHGEYDAESQAYDALVRDAQPSGSAVPNAGNQEMVFVFSAGNSGPGTVTVGSPGTAKNVICVGASESVRSLSVANGGSSSTGADGCGDADTAADSANDIASFSSRGTCADGRKKPDLVAPGTHITGGVPQASTSTNGTGLADGCFSSSFICALPGSGTPGSAYNFFPLSQQFYSESSGTSHSTPGVAGACALVRQYFINLGSNPPSPAMTKAFLANSARYLTGAGANDTLPSSSQGMGEVNLGFAFNGVARMMRDQLSADKFTASGQTRTTLCRIADVTKPLRVTLVWTDSPGSTVGNAYNNNLNLTVTIGGNAYKGNVFSGAVSITGGTADAKNNVESVFLPAGVSGDFVVTVTAADINSDGVPNEAPALDQDYALVIYNAITPPPAAAPLLSAMGVVSNQFQFMLTGTVSSNYVVEVTTNLNNGVWTPVRTNGAPFLFSQPTTNAQRFYRGAVAH